MKKVQLERILQSLEPVASPRPELEQYATPAAIAAEVAYLALGKGDLADRAVVDLGCGNGVLAIAAKLLGAREVVGVDVDPRAVAIAGANARRVEVDVDWRTGDVAGVQGTFDTVLMNPPFGSQTKHADLPFLDRALDLGSVVYSFHNGVTEGFVASRVAARGGRITDRIPYAFPLPHTFHFQREDVRAVPVVLFRTEVPKG